MLNLGFLPSGVHILTFLSHQLNHTINTVFQAFANLVFLGIALYFVTCGSFQISVTTTHSIYT